ncbi:fimbrial chaperone [Providencia rettgeri]
MNKLNKLISIFFILYFHHAVAEFTIDGTRFIYEEGKKNISFSVTNKSSKAYGGQIWIDNDSATDTVYMVSTPPFFKLNAEDKQIVRIIKTESDLPIDRESLFWVNIQEIPPKENVIEGNFLFVAINTKLKLFYRPNSLIKGRKNAENKIETIHLDDGFYLNNPTPYYFTVFNVYIDERKLKLPESVESELAVFSPFKKIYIGSNIVKGNVSLDTINDWGGVENIKLHKQ